MPTIDELKYLSGRRLEAVEVLANNDIHDIAYHDSGYIVEFALKAAICKFKNLEEYPNSREYFTHHFDDLVRLAGLELELSNQKSHDREFMKNWSISTNWSVELRYKPIGSTVESVSETFINAVKNEEGGVLPWIKKHW